MGCLFCNPVMTMPSVYGSDREPVSEQAHERHYLCTYQETLRIIERDQRSYTFDEEELKVHETILKPEVTENDAKVLEKSLSRSYPGLSFDNVLEKENKKLQMELQIMKKSVEFDQCDVIQHLIEVTERTLSQKSGLKLVNSKHGGPGNKSTQQTDKELIQDCYGLHHPLSGLESVDEKGEEMASSPLKQDTSLERISVKAESWRNSLVDCCMDPCLCLSTFIYPCGTFSNIAAIASDGNVSQEDACNGIMAYSLVLGCFCYTSYFRRKLRKHFNIPVFLMKR
eukprot:c12679_g1_i2 orf=22-870(+)